MKFPARATLMALAALLAADPALAWGGRCPEHYLWRPSHRVCAKWAPRAFLRRVRRGHAVAQYARHRRAARVHDTHGAITATTWAGKIPYYAFSGMPGFKR